MIIADTADPLGVALRELDQVERSTIADELPEPSSEFADEGGGGYRVPGVVSSAAIVAVSVSGTRTRPSRE